MSDRTVLVVGTHPNDEVLGAGETIAKHAAAGDRVYTLIVTEGTAQPYNDEEFVIQKQDEARRCGDVLGVESVRFGYTI